MQFKHGAQEIMATNDLIPAPLQGIRIQPTSKADCDGRVVGNVFRVELIQEPHAPLGI